MAAHTSATVIAEPSHPDDQTSSPSVTSITTQNDAQTTTSHTAGVETSPDGTSYELDAIRHALSRLPADDPDLPKATWAFTSMLMRRFEETGSDTLLHECIDLRRQACAVYNEGHPDYAGALDDLANALRVHYDMCGDISLLTEATDLGRQALSLRPQGHPRRSISCSNLAISLMTCFTLTGAESLLAEVISLEREALSLEPLGSAARCITCSNLARSLLIYSERTGDESLFTEAIDLQREALSLGPHGHRSRSTFCSNLAVSLKIRFERTGDETLLAEAIDLERESLSLDPPGDHTRSTSCSNLAKTLKIRYSQTGDEALLTEAIDLGREALSLTPHGHPKRSTSCLDLAKSLWIRFGKTKDDSLLAEAIELEREALVLIPRGNPERSTACSYMAASLRAHFRQTGNESLLAEAVNLNREALSLTPRGHPGRSMSCADLAGSLIDCFDHTGDESLLSEAAELDEDALDCMAPNDPSRWRPLTGLVMIYLAPHFSRRSLRHAIDYLQQALSITSDDPPLFHSRVTTIIHFIEFTNVTRDLEHQLLQCLSAVIDLSSTVAGFVLDKESQLRYLRDCRRIGPHAYRCAVLCGKPELGLELLERTRAMMWSQSLHMRDPQLSSAPPALASELKQLLHSMSIPLSIQNISLSKSVTSDPSWIKPQDIRHKNNARIQRLIREIRSIPGNEYFMRGVPYDVLAKCATCNPVVVLVAARDECHVLIPRPNDQAPITLVLQDVTPKELATMSIAVSAAQMRGSTLDGEQKSRLGMGVALRSSTSSFDYNRYLRKLWTAVVKPVIDCLQLQVCRLEPSSLWQNNEDFGRKPLDHCVRVSTGARLAPSCSFRYMLRAYMMSEKRIAARITSSLLILLHLRPSYVRRSRIQGFARPT
jgi:tetratricopeptide (TPR) repeat protein